MNNEQLLDLVKQMTLEEKTAQLLQLTANFTKGRRPKARLLDRWKKWGLQSNLSLPVAPSWAYQAHRPLLMYNKPI